MPQVAAWAAAAIVSAVTGTAVTAAAVAAGTAGTMAAVVYAGANIAINLAIGVAATVLMAPDVRASSASPTTWQADPDAGIPFVAGRRGTAGLIVQREAFGKSNKYQSIVTVYSGAGPIQGYSTLKFDDVVYAFDGGGDCLTPSIKSGRCWWSTRLGAQPDTALVSPTLTGGVAMAHWGSAYKLSGKACSMFTLHQDGEGTHWPAGEPAPIIVVLGNLAYDPRLDSTYPGGSGSQRRDDWTTWEYTADPYLHGLAWARGHFKLNTDGTIDRTKRIAGVGAPDSAIDIAAFVEGANICTANDWTISGEWTTVDDKWQVLAAMLQAGGGVPLTRGAKISCMVEAPRTSILTLTGEDIVGAVSLNVMASRRDRPNTIVPRVRLEAQQFQEVALGAVSASTYVTEDGGETRTREVPYRYVGEAKQGAELAAYGLANARETLKASLPCKPHLLGLRAGDAFTVNSSEHGLNGQKFVVLKRAFDPSSAIVTLDVRSETDAKHAWALGQSADPPDTPTLTSDRTATAPDSAEWSFDAEALTEGLGTIPALVFTGAVTDESQADQVIFEYRVVDTPEREWAGAGVESADAVRKEVTSITTGTAYQGAVSYRKGIRISERLVLGPVTAGDLVIVNPGARRPISRSVTYPISGTTDTTITVVAHDVWFQDGSTESLPSATLTSLTAGTQYGVFWRDGDGYEVEVQPASTHMTTGRWVFVGWAETSSGGVYPTPSTPPPGWGGSGETTLPDM